MQSEKTEKKYKFIIDIIFFGVIIALIFCFFNYLFIWLLPFFIGFAITLTIEPITKFLCKKFKFNRKVAGTITALSFWAILCFALCKLSIILFNELKNLITALPYIFSNLTNTINNLLNNYKDLIISLPEPIKASGDNISLTFKNSIDHLSNNITTFLTDFITKIATDLPNYLIFLAVSIVASSFIAADFPKISRFIMTQVPFAKREIVIDSKNFIFDAILKFIRVQFTLIFITFCELAIGFSLLRINYAFLLASLIAIVDVLPLIGTNTVVIPWGLFEIISGQPIKGILLILLSVSISLIRQFLEPKMLGKHLGLNPLLTLISIYVGLQLFGIVGMLSLPILLMLLKYLQDMGHIRIWKEPKKE